MLVVRAWVKVSCWRQDNRVYGLVLDRPRRPLRDKHYLFAAVSHRRFAVALLAKSAQPKKVLQQPPRLVELSGISDHALEIVGQRTYSSCKAGFSRSKTLYIGIWSSDCTWLYDYLSLSHEEVGWSGNASPRTVGTCRRVFGGCTSGDNPCICQFRGSISVHTIRLRPTIDECLISATMWWGDTRADCVDRELFRLGLLCTLLLIAYQFEKSPSCPNWYEILRSYTSLATIVCYILICREVCDFTWLIVGHE